MKTHSTDSYLAETYYCNYNHPSIRQLSDSLSLMNKAQEEKMDILFHHVRDNIRFGLDVVRVRASRTLQKGYGVCYNKGLLLTALLRLNGVPARLSSVPLASDFARPAIGLISMFQSNPFNHCFVEANLGGNWAVLDPTQDRGSYSTFFQPLNVSWAIDWATDRDNINYADRIVGEKVILADIDRAINANVGNLIPPKLSAYPLFAFVNRRMWKKVDAKTGLT
jgi:transglutaminase-like putative cysteine protease